MQHHTITLPPLLHSGHDTSFFLASSVPEDSRQNMAYLPEESRGAI